MAIPPRCSRPSALLALLVLAATTARAQAPADAPFPDPTASPASEEDPTQLAPDEAADPVSTSNEGGAPPGAETDVVETLSPEAEPLAAEEPAEKDDDFLRELSRGLTLDDLGVQLTWTGYGDVSATVAPWDEASFVVGHFNLIPVARLSDEVWAEMEIEIEDTVEIKIEYATLTYAPFPWLNLRAGRFLVPVGRFNRDLHPSFRWEQIARPMMMNEVVPVAWSDVGLEMGGLVDVGSWMVLQYTGFVTNGLRLTDAQEASGRLDVVMPLPSSPKDAPLAGDVATSARPLRDMKKLSGLEDNNLDKAFGGRLGVTLFPGAFGQTIVGVSAYTVSPDAAARYRFTIVDADAELRLDSFVLRGEVAQSILSDYLGTERQLFETGAYLQAVFTYGLLRLAARGDFAMTRPDFGDYAWRTGLTPTVMFMPFTFMNLRAEVLFPFDQTFALETPTFHGMLAFMF